MDRLDHGVLNVGARKYIVSELKKETRTARYCIEPMYDGSFYRGVCCHGLVTSYDVVMMFPHAHVGTVKTIEEAIQLMRMMN